MVGGQIRDSAIASGIVSKYRGRPCSSERPPRSNAVSVLAFLHHDQNGTVAQRGDPGHFRQGLEAGEVHVVDPPGVEHQQVDLVLAFRFRLIGLWQDVDGAVIRNQLALPNHSRPFSANAAMPGPRSPARRSAAARCPCPSGPASEQFGTRVRDA